MTTMQVRVPGRSMVVRPQSARRSLVVRSAPKKEQIDQAVKEAEDACAGGDQGEWYVMVEWMNEDRRFSGSCVGRCIPMI